MNQNKDFPRPFSEAKLYDEDELSQEEAARQDKVLQLTKQASISIDKHTLYTIMKQNIGGKNKYPRTDSEDFASWLNGTRRDMMLYMTQDAFDKINWREIYPSYVGTQNFQIAQEDNKLPAIQAIIESQRFPKRSQEINLVLSALVYIIDIPGESFVIAGTLVTSFVDKFVGPTFHITGVRDAITAEEISMARHLSNDISDGKNCWEDNSFAITDASGKTYVFSRDNADFTVIL